MSKYLKLFPLILFSIFVFFLTSCDKKRVGKPRVLVFSKTAGFHHESIAPGNEALLKLGLENNFLVDTIIDASIFNEDSLKNYSAVVFLNTTGDLLNHVQEADFERYIQAGGGFVGIHAAADAEYDWGWYGRLVGGYFKSHPAVQEAKLVITDKNHPATKDLLDTWVHTDEWYNYNKLSKEIQVLMTMDDSSYKGADQEGDVHPMAWYQKFDGGRAFYTGLGHRNENFTDPLFLKHLLGGIEYAIGENYELDYTKAKTLRVPEEERFSKVVLSEGGFFEPTEMAILPNLNILVAQRRGELMLYNSRKQTAHSSRFFTRLL